MIPGRLDCEAMQRIHSTGLRPLFPPPLLSALSMALRPEEPYHGRRKVEGPSLSHIACLTTVAQPEDGAETAGRTNPRSQQIDFDMYTPYNSAGCGK